MTTRQGGVEGINAWPWKEWGPEEWAQHDGLVASIIDLFEMAVLPKVEHMPQEGITPSIVSLSVVNALLGLAAPYAVNVIINANTQLQPMGTKEITKEERSAMADRFLHALSEMVSVGLKEEAFMLGMPNPSRTREEENVKPNQARKTAELLHRVKLAIAYIMEETKVRARDSGVSAFDCAEVLVYGGLTMLAITATDLLRAACRPRPEVVWDAVRERMKDRLQASWVEGYKAEADAISLGGADIGKAG